MGVGGVGDLPNYYNITWDEDTKNFTSSPPKNEISAQKRPNLAQHWHFWPNVGPFGPPDPMPGQKTIGNKMPRSFSIMWVPKLGRLVAVARAIDTYLLYH